MSPCGPNSSVPAGISSSLSTFSTFSFVIFMSPPAVEYLFFVARSTVGMTGSPVLMLPKKTHPPPGLRDLSPRAPPPCDRAAPGENTAKFNPPRAPPRQDSLERIQPRAKSSRNLSPSRATTASGLPPAARSHTTRAPERHGQRPTKPRPGLALGWSRRQSPSSGARVYSIYQVRPTRCNRRLHRFHHPTLDLRSRRAL